MKKRELRSLYLYEIEEDLVKNGFKKYRAKQIYNWVSKSTNNFDEMKNIPKDLLDYLRNNFILENMTIEKVVKSKDNTQKFLLKLKDNHVIETVLMKYRHGYSICISTQIGCQMGCQFCASTIGGKVRDLTPGEMLGQIMTLQNYIGERIGNVVLMGSGEPLDNYDAVLKFLKLVNDDDGLNISHRSITLSTVGIVPKIYELAEESLQITLAISLHEVDEFKRTALIPVNKKYSVKEIIKACKFYTKKTKRRITFEYSLINGVNDNMETAIALGKLLKGMLCHVNLIPINAVVEKDFKPSSEINIIKFKETLEKFGIVTTIRREMGSDINAACGQLRNDFIK
ncbi:MAG TPA: 23S rRNA (adenine(2503)-C(2))-methyltransferase RlmN [Clostridia bacterium]|nr:23S rRNA (adenine(2503)-C(2))-methyltransferase RlmN [Clostridia bacterium]